MHTHTHACTYTYTHTWLYIYYFILDISLASVTQLIKAIAIQPFSAILKDLTDEEVKDYIHDVIHSKFACHHEAGYEVCI